jgi:hypothetical protein
MLLSANKLERLSQVITFLTSLMFARKTRANTRAKALAHLLAASMTKQKSIYSSSLPANKLEHLFMTIAFPIGLIRLGPMLTNADMGEKACQEYKPLLIFWHHQ